jgi:hypothetical protein
MAAIEESEILRTDPPDCEGKFGVSSWPGVAELRGMWRAMSRI